MATQEMMVNLELRDPREKRVRVDHEAFPEDR